ncbi:hypothetical protein P775_02595 [Puniceibacterium antarcticum]|uniref:Metallo-beta-lactamase domain-containing protein n=1 Tax=Puniceibacterium antarcticum TaxID=1206336 RepID=A0A2G8RJX4_9RHOB|nr:MBL fold metallo-hydrolase [Puniceibacterium antarcticum]PIL21884.1 hypothetical protein P775_02595 [Puniceibacterium antarcticum]
MFTRTSPSTGSKSPQVDGFYDPATGSVQYVVSDPATKQAALIDIVMDFDPASARTSFHSAQTALDFVRDTGLTVQWILDTHPHADHLMAQHWLKEQTGAPTGIGEKTHDIATLWAEIYNLPDSFDPARDFDHLYADGDRFKLGNLDVQVILSPGHTLGSVTYVIGDAAFVHDTFMHVDSGTTRADFPGGSSAELYTSLQRLLTLPDDTRLFVGHDYPPVGERTDPAWESTVKEQRAHNTHIGGGVTEADYRKLRDARDSTLNLPARMLHALQVNLRGGRLPDPEQDGQRYYKIPANRFPERNT